jgi:cystathionine beta-lyase/cystathionine gamma-synthase
VESVIVQPSRTSHQGLPPAEKAALGITDDLLRLSVGIEDWEDLRDDLGQALAG